MLSSIVYFKECIKQINKSSSSILNFYISKGVCESALKALEKQIPKKLINTCQYVSGCCPNCKKYISDWLEYNKFMCCPNCGQNWIGGMKIKWVVI